MSTKYLTEIVEAPTHTLYRKGSWSFYLAKHLSDAALERLYQWHKSHAHIKRHAWICEILSTTA